MKGRNIHWCISSVWRTVTFLRLIDALSPSWCLSLFIMPPCRSLLTCRGLMSSWDISTAVEGNMHPHILSTQKFVALHLDGGVAAANQQCRSSNLLTFDFTVYVSVLHGTPHVSVRPVWWCHVPLLHWSVQSLCKHVMESDRTVHCEWSLIACPGLLLWIRYNSSMGERWWEPARPYEPVWNNIICADWCSRTRHKGHIYHSCCTSVLIESASIWAPISAAISWHDLQHINTSQFILPLHQTCEQLGGH